jgi:hypothetical protein
VPDNAFLNSLAIDPKNPMVLYVGLYDSTSGNSVYKSTDGGIMWYSSSTGLPNLLGIYDLAIDPNTSSIIYAAVTTNSTVNGGVFKSIDSGETWIAAQNGLPDPIEVIALAIDPSAPTRIYAATQQGVFRSTDAAASWTPINSGLTSLDVWSLSIDRTGSLLRAATAAGLFEYQLSGSPPAGTTPVVEYFYAAFDHYFITSDPGEISELDRGRRGAHVEERRRVRAGSRRRPHL